MTRVAMRDLGGEYARIFGAPALSEAPGRSRKCKVCGDWHKLDRPWPHNCRSEAPPRADFPAPLLAPKFDPFMTGQTGTAEYIADRRAKREFMERNDLVEFDEGVGQRNDWVEQHEHEREIVADLKRFHETDPLNLPPDLKAGRLDETGSLSEGTEINADSIEVIK